MLFGARRCVVRCRALPRRTAHVETCGKTQICVKRNACGAQAGCSAGGRQSAEVCAAVRYRAGAGGAQKEVRGLVMPFSSFRFAIVSFNTFSLHYHCLRYFLSMPFSAMPFLPLFDISSDAFR